jgi:hypothetical protein
MASVFEEQRVISVFYENGTFSTDKRQKRLLRAPFEIVTIPGLGGSQFIRPRGLNGIHNLSLNFTDFVDGADEAFLVNGIDGFDGGDRVVLSGEHEMGGFQSPNENWKDVHRFAWI